MKSREEYFTQFIAHAVMICLSIFALLPFVLLIIASFTDNQTAIIYGYSFTPKKWSLEAFDYIFREWRTIGRAYGVTVVVTSLGTTMSLLITSMLAYALSKDDLPGRNILMFIVIFTMLFNGGIVSSYFIYNNIFKIRNTIWALIVPGLLMNGFNIILVRNYYRSNIPLSLFEVAELDGIGELTVFFMIVVPLSLPIFATTGLMTAIMYWNDWTNGLYYLTERGGSHLYNIQNILNRVNENINFLANNASRMGGQAINTSQIPSTTVRMAIAAVGIVPILVVYPFFQKYFVRGITIGAVKE
ncbi:MAG: carbohydrate ABC transporter permease [Treponema sp.]|jgi:putative aldouronate transport system permease protein|nr:carbohydrate ABC transporter permease [Treponema sp.]